MTVGSHETSKEQFIASPPFPHKGSISALVVPELWRQRRKMSIFRGLLGSFTQNHTVSIPRKKNSAFCYKEKYTNVFFLCKDTAVCF